MALILRQSTAVDVLIGPFLDVTDGKTAETGESPAVKLSKNGQTLAAKNDATTPTHDADGYYNCEFDATDTNTVGQLVATVVGTATALPVRHEFLIVEEAVYDILYAASATGAVPVASIANGAITAAAIATDAIDADAIADNAINAGALATGAITNAKFAAGAIDAAALAADAGTEIGTAVWATAARTLTALDEDSTTIDIDGIIQAALDSRLDAIDSALTAIDAKTTNLPSDPADQSLIIAATNALAARFDTVDTNLAIVDGIVDAILVDTDTTIPGLIAALDTLIDSIIVVTNKLDDTLEDDGGTFRFTAAALAESPAGGGSLSLTTEIEDGVNYLQTLRAIAAAIAGNVTGGGSNAETFKAIGNPGTTRLINTATQNGTREVTLSL